MGKVTIKALKLLIITGEISIPKIVVNVSLALSFFIQIGIVHSISRMGAEEKA